MWIFMGNFNVSAVENNKAKTIDLLMHGKPLKMIFF